MQLLQNGKQQFIDQNGAPLANGSVYFYAPGTTNPMPTYQDPAGSILNTNPVALDSRGQAIVWGSGTYRQVVKDCNGNTIWDQITRDSNAALLGNIADNTFVAGTDFTPGTTAQLTLTATPGSLSNLWVFFDSVYQDDSQLSSVSGTTLTFAAPIPAGVNKVFVKIGTTVAVGTPSSGSVDDKAIASGSKIANRVSAVVDVRDTPFNAKCNGVADDSAALQAAVNSFGGKPGVVLLPPGSIGVSAKITLPPGVSVKGCGSSSTTIVPLTAGMTVFEQVFTSGSGSNQRLSDFNINCGTVANVVGMNFVYCNRMDLENISFFGCMFNFKYDRGGVNRVINCTSAPSSTLPAGKILLWSSTDTEYGFVFSQITNYRIEGGSLGVQSPAVYFRRAVGVKANIITNDSNYTGYGMIIENDCQGICVHDSIFVGFATGALFQMGGGISVPPTFCTFNNVDFDQNSAVNLLIAEGVNNSFIGGMYTSSAVGTTNPAIKLVGQNAANNLFDAVTISGYNGSGGTGISLTNTSSNSVTNCKITNCSTGISFGDANNVNTRILNNDLSVGVTTAISGSPQGSGNDVRGNKGYSPANAVVTPAMTVSGASITNIYGVPVRIFVSAGVVTSMTINGVTTPFTGGLIVLYPSEVLSLTYSTAPVWGWIGM